MCSVIKGRASSPLTFQMDVKPGERILNTLKYLKTEAVRRGWGGGQKELKVQISELSLSLLLPLSTARLLAPLSPPVSADPSCTDIHLFVQESPPLTIKGTNIYSLFLMLLRVSFFFYWGGGLFTSQKLLFPLQSPPPPQYPSVLSSLNKFQCFCKWCKVHLL